MCRRALALDETEERLAFGSTTGGLWISENQGDSLACVNPAALPDADTVYRRAKAARAEIVVEIKDEDYGGRVFSCRDPEGHLWNIPWKASS